jgi:hypothetical protein
VALGVTASGAGAGDGSLMLPHYYLPVMLDGRVIGGGTSEVYIAPLLYTTTTTYFRMSTKAIIVAMHAAGSSCTVEYHISDTLYHTA